MWRRLHTLAPALRRAAAAAAAGAPASSAARAAPLSSAAAAFRRTSPLLSEDKPARVEDIMPIATGHEREELEAELQGKKRFDMDPTVGPFGTKVLGYEPTSHLSGAQVLPRWFSSLASNGSQVQKSQISETYKSGGEMKQSDAQRSSEEATPKVLAFSPLEAAIAKPRSGPLTLESHRVRRSEILTQVTFYMIPALLLVSKNSISTSLLVGAVFHQVYMFHKEILLDYVHHDITRKWSLIYFKLLLLVMAKDTIVYFNMF